MELKAYQARVLRNHKNDIPELQEQLKQNEYAMKAEFRESALSLRIPQFSIPVQLPPQFVFDEAEEENSCTRFYKESLCRDLS